MTSTQVQWQGGEVFPWTGWSIPQVSAPSVVYRDQPPQCLGYVTPMYCCRLILLLIETNEPLHEKMCLRGFATSACSATETGSSPEV